MPTPGESKNKSHQAILYSMLGESHQPCNVHLEICQEVCELTQAKIWSPNGGLPIKTGCQAWAKK